MKLSIKAMAMASAVVWGGAVLDSGSCQHHPAKYGKEFLRVVASISSRISCASRRLAMLPSEPHTAWSTGRSEVHSVRGSTIVS